MQVIDCRMLTKESPFLTTIVLSMGRQGRQLGCASLGGGQQCFHITDLLNKAGTLSCRPGPALGKLYGFKKR